MTVFIAFAPADRAAAENLERVLERRGQFAELDDGLTALRPVTGGDALVLMLSNTLLFATARLRLEQRALDAWAIGRLVLVKLDDALAPVGLRDQPSIDATGEAHRELAWAETAADAIHQMMRAPAHASGDEDAAVPVRKDSWRKLMLLLLAAAPGAFAASLAMYLANRSGPRPGGWPELAGSVDAFGLSLGLPPGFTPWLFAGAISVSAIALAVAATQFAKSLKGGRRAAARPASPPGGPVFVSYARANQSDVSPIVEAARLAGRAFWPDQKGGVAGDIVRAIRNAASVVVMCSKAAFESDHVKREIYLADRYKKRLMPVFLENAEPPEDFDYFFAGAQALKLFETPEAERPQAFVRVLR
jgi:hypothetical protein